MLVKAMIFSLRNVAGIKENLIYLFLLIYSFWRKRKKKIETAPSPPKMKMRFYRVANLSIPLRIHIIPFISFSILISPSPYPYLTYIFARHNPRIDPWRIFASLTYSHATNGYPCILLWFLGASELNSFSHIFLFHVSCQW